MKQRRYQKRGSSSSAWNDLAFLAYFSLFFKRNRRELGKNRENISGISTEYLQEKRKERGTGDTRGHAIALECILTRFARRFA